MILFLSWFRYFYLRLEVLLGMRSETILLAKRKSARPFAKLGYRLHRAELSFFSWVWPNRAAKRAIWLLEETRRYPIREADRRMLGDATPVALPYRDGALNGYVWGKGPRKVLFVHGWEGRCTQMATVATVLVHAGFQVLLFDMPGHGETTGEGGGIFDMADGTQFLSEHFHGIDFLVGHSSGCFSNCVALMRGLRVKAVAQIGSPTHFTIILDGFAKLMNLRPLVRRRMEEVLEKRHGVRVANIGIGAVCGFDVPALICHDKGDMNVPFEAALKFVEAWPGAELFTTQNAGHLGMLRRASLGERLVDFFNRHSGDNCVPA